MDRGDITQSIVALLRKYRWAVLLLAVGLLLMGLPEKKDPSMPSDPPEAATQEVTLQQELESLLSKLEGAGKVKVLLSIASGPQNHYQTDEDISAAADVTDHRKETVIITSSDRDQQGLLKWVDPPRYLGAVVLCQGAEDARVKLSVVHAVATATGLTSDRISVFKMK